MVKITPAPRDPMTSISRKLSNENLTLFQTPDFIQGTPFPCILLSLLSTVRVERVEKVGRKKKTPSSKSHTTRMPNRRSERVGNFKCCRENDKVRSNGFFFSFSKGQQKVNCSCYHWDISHFSPRGDFLFCLFLLCIFYFKQGYGRMPEQLEKLWVEMKGPEKERMAEMGKQSDETPRFERKG